MSHSPHTVFSNAARAPRILALPALLATAALLGACGGSGPATNAAATERSREQAAETKFADFARCLREHGVNAEALSRPGGGHGLKVSPGRAGPGGMEAAEKACGRYRPEPQQANLSPQQKVELEERVQKFAKCMREHGIKVEASTGGGGVHISVHAHPSETGAPNPESPGFKQAQGACQKLLPMPLGAKGGESRSAGAAPTSRASNGG